MEIKIERVYKHFKGNLYKVLLIAKDTTTLEELVVYQDFTDKTKIWARSKEEFVSIVDTKKYPLVKQKYRFEIVDDK